MKKITAGDLAKWNGLSRTVGELIEWLEMKPHLDSRHSKLLSDLIVAHNNFVDSSEELEEEYN
jgi:hypothetical protein